MNQTLKAIFILIVFLLISPPSFAGQFKVTRVYDGDTIKASGHDIEIKVRLVGIDAPETSKKKNEPGQPFSKQATKYLAGLVLNKTVQVMGYGLDRHNRVLGVVFVNGTNANLEMIKAGLAEVYRGKHPKLLNTKIYKDAEKEAKEAKRGMWSLDDKYISPKVWRKGKRN
jgi:endonuclease YncB( thermonuclease family)